ncbi:MAG: Lipoprotein releasing system transrane protein LolC [Bacteroidota bacterium]|jgi:lipoprotein-releasing system permease protein
MKHFINREIAFTYTTSSKKLTTVAVLGVLLGMAVFMFMNSMLVGFDKTASTSIFKSTPHIRIYKDDVISEPLFNTDESTTLIVNPKVVPSTNTIIDPQSILELMRKQEGVIVALPQVVANVFYNNGKSQLAGSSIGFLPAEGNRMFDIKSFMVQGNFDDLANNQNGIVIGSGIARKMNLNTGDNISLTSSKGVNKVMKVVGIFETKNSKEDKTKSYINILSAQQLMKEGNSYVTDINVNVIDPEKAAQYAEKFSMLTGYKVEDWKMANETFMAGSRMRKIVITFVSFTILLVAAFGIYNILNMTVSQKINDIAILKAMGFRGKDVIQIFVTQALTIGIVGVILGVIVATILVNIMQHVYVGGDIGYFPIAFEPMEFLKGIIIGVTITFLAGYMPARKAAKVDPVNIFRK